MYQIQFRGYVPGTTNELFPTLLLMLIAVSIEGEIKRSSTLVFQRACFTYDAVFQGGVRLGAPGTKKE
jgi:hypothetical protein